MEWGVAGGILKLVLGVVIAVPLAFYFMQDKLIFQPQPLHAAQRALISKRFPSVGEIALRAPDGTGLHAWHLKGEPLVVYFGGNAEEVSWMLAEAAANAPGTGWLLVDYRGYGSSEGAPSERALVADALQWFDHARDRLGAKDIVIFGRSLGTGIAVQVAALRAVRGVIPGVIRGVILVAPYDSLTKVGQHHYPFLPVGLMLKHPFDSVQRAPQIAVPLLCMVAAHDEVVPIVHSKRLYDAWKGPKRWVELTGAGHNSADEAPPFWRAIREFLVQSH